LNSILTEITNILESLVITEDVGRKISRVIFPEIARAIEDKEVVQCFQQFQLELESMLVS
jgi:hypothetical protein